MFRIEAKKHVSKHDAEGKKKSKTVMQQTLS